MTTPSGKRGPAFVDHVLRPCYQMARRRFFPEIMAVNLAHVLMLVRRGIIPLDAGRLLVGAVLDCWSDPHCDAYDPTYEDLFFRIEAEIERLVGPDVAGHLHVAFSRNDLDAAIYRMTLRCDLIAIIQQELRLRERLLALAGEHLETVMPAYTHNQQAQPTTLAHYLLGVAAMLGRDGERLLGLWPRLNRSPMGAAALATTGFPIDRDYVASRLGFEGLAENSYDAVAAHDHHAEVAAAVWVMATNLSRFVHDLMLLASNEFGALRLDDCLVQVSSIMPQKRNPVALERLRGMLSRVCGGAAGVFQMAHNVPYGDVNDVGEDLQPLLDELCAGARHALDLLREGLEHTHFDVDVLARRARDGFATATELADTLVRDRGIPFRRAHAIVSRFAELAGARGLTPAAAGVALLDEAAREATGTASGLTEAAFLAAIDPLEFVRRRSVRGGPNPAEARRALDAAGAALRVDAQRVGELEARLASARAELLADAQALDPNADPSRLESSAL